MELGLLKSRKIQVLPHALQKLGKVGYRIVSLAESVGCPHTKLLGLLSPDVSSNPAIGSPICLSLLSGLLGIAEVATTNYTKFDKIIRLVSPELLPIRSH